MFTAREDILMTLFHCGICDLSLLDDIQYDAEDVLEQLRGCCGLDDLDINMYVRAAFDLGFIEIREAVENRIDELKSYEERGDLTEEEQEELDEILRLDPDADCGSYHNCIDTHAYIEKNGEVYHRYFQDALDNFENNTGFPLESWD